MSQEIKRLGRLSYERCAELLGERRDTKHIGPHTWIRKLTSSDYNDPDDDSPVYGILFHNTFIVRFYSDGSVLLDTGGYETVTTKQRIKELAGVGLYAKDHVWYVGKRKYYDGMNVGRPQSQCEALQTSAEEGDDVAALALRDMVQESA